WRYGSPTRRSHNPPSERYWVCLRIPTPAISRVGNGGWPGLSVKTPPGQAVSGTDPAHWSPVARVVASQIPRSISSSEKNQNRFARKSPPKAKNRQIRLLERAQSSSHFNSF